MVFQGFKTLISTLCDPSHPLKKYHSYRFYRSYYPPYPAACDHAYPVMF
jgi:hypothetical protein